MSQKPTRPTSPSEPPLDPDAPPNLGLGLRDQPDVKALLAELSEGLKEGEDPLFYKMAEAPEEDSGEYAPNEARVYVGPTTLRPAHHKTLELDRVKVDPEVDPRRAKTLVPSVWAGRAASTPIDKAALPSALGPEGDAPPMSRPASTREGAGAGAGAGGKRGPAAIGVLVVAAVVAVLGVVAMRGPRGGDGGSRGAASASAGPAEAGTGSARVPSATALATAAPRASGSAGAGAMVTPSATAAAPRATVAPSPTAAPSAAGHARTAEPKDPYEDAVPSAASPAAVSSATAAPSVTVAPAPKAPYVEEHPEF
jgi:hypothetical protein